jgi:hypothetical protein
VIFFEGVSDSRFRGRDGGCEFSASCSVKPLKIFLSG